MIRRRRRAATFAVVASTIGALAYGCGGGGGASSSGGVDTDASGLPEGAVVLPDGNVVVPEGATSDTGASDAKGDAPSEAGDAGVDVRLDSGADADADADGDPPPPPGPLSPGYVDYDINHVLETGQSNAVASGGRPENTLPLNTAAFTNAQPYGNLMFDTGVMTSRNCNGSGCPSANYVEPNAFAPLIENDGFFSGGPPAFTGDRVETASSATANEISYLALTNFEFNVRPGYPTKHDVLVSEHGRSGNTYWCLRKGGCNYKPATEIKAFDEAIKQVQAGKRLADAAAKSYVVRAVTSIHGESDHYAYQDNGDNHPEFPLVGTNGVANRIQEYDDALIEWQEDYESMVKGITGQAQPVPLFITGLSGWTGAKPSKLSLLQLSAHVRAPGKVVYVAPGYIFEGGVKKDGTLECLHYSVYGQRQAGEYFAKAYAKVVFEGGVFEPVRPIDVQRAGNVVSVKFLVPKPPLALDTTLVAAIANMGFEFLLSGAPQTITSVAISAPDTVAITLAATPGAGVKRLTYAQNQPSPGCIGPGVKAAGGACGNLRDSDATASLSGLPLYNWSVSFDVVVP